MTFSHHVRTRKRLIWWRSTHEFRYDACIANDRFH